MKLLRMILPALLVFVAGAALGNGVAGADDGNDQKQPGTAVIQRAPAPQGSLGSPLACNGPTVAFESGIPADWWVGDTAGFGVVWTTVAASGEAGNFTGGGGGAASVSSDKAGTVEFDTELRSPWINLAGYTGVTLTYLANYQNLASEDFLDLQISRDFGDTWGTLLSWNEDHGAFRNTPGQLVVINLSAYAGLSSAQLRWRYYEPTSPDFDWYAQIDNVALTCSGAIPPTALSCNSGPTDFNSGIPGNWLVYDYAGQGVYWKNISGSGETGNYTGGTGDAASVSSDQFGPAEVDTVLRTPSFDLTGYDTALLKFDGNFQNFASEDFLDLGVGGPFTKGYNPLLSWNEDHGTFRSVPGESITVSLSSYTAYNSVHVRWRYYDPGAGDFNWYAQVDNVQLLCSSSEKWGDVDCNGAVNAVDALKVQRFAAALSVSQTEPCVNIGTTVNANAIATKPFGDLDCSGVVNAVDALKTQRFAAGLFVTQSAPCPTTGVAVDLYY